MNETFYVVLYFGLFCLLCFGVVVFCLLFSFKFLSIILIIFYYYYFILCLVLYNLYCRVKLFDFLLATQFIWLGCLCNTSLLAYSILS